MSRAVSSMFPEPVIHVIDLMLRKAERLIAWERAMLGLSTRTETHHDLVNLPEVTERIVARYEEEAKKKSVKLIADVAPDALVVGNSGAMHELIRQLVFSALENAPRGGCVAVSGAVMDGIVTLSFCSDGLEPERTNCNSFPAEFSTFGNQNPTVCLDHVGKVLAAHGGWIERSTRPVDGIRLLVRLPVSE